MRRAAKVDSTAKDLVLAARQMGAKVLVLNGVIDALVLGKRCECCGQGLRMIDWKTAQGKKAPRVRLTSAQEALLADGWPLELVADMDGLKRILGAK